MERLEVHGNQRIVSRSLHGDAAFLCKHEGFLRMFGFWVWFWFLLKGVTVGNGENTKLLRNRLHKLIPVAC